MNTIIANQLSLLSITADSAVQMSKLTYRKARFDYNTRLIPFCRDTWTILTVVYGILSVLYHDLFLWGIDLYVQSSSTDPDDNDPKLDYRPAIAQSLTVPTVSTTVQIITDDMLLSKKGKPLTGGARAARIKKLIKDGYTL